MNKFTPRELELKVEEWRQKRLEKWAGRLQIHADKKRNVSCKVFGMVGSTVQLPTPPSCRSASDLRATTFGAVTPMRKSYSHADIRRHSFHPQHQYRNDMSHEINDVQGGYNNYRSTQPTHPASPRRYQSFRGPIGTKSEPRKSYASQEFRRGYKNNCQSQEKKLPKSVLLKKNDLGNEVTAKEKTVHFQDEVMSPVQQNSTHPEIKISPSRLQENDDSEENLNSTFVIEDNEPNGGNCHTNPIMDVNQSGLLDSVQSIQTVEVETTRPDEVSEAIENIPIKDQDPENVEPLKSEIKNSPTKKSTYLNEEITGKMDELCITTPIRGRKSRVLVDSTNIVQSSVITYVTRELKHKEAPTEVVITPVKRSTRIKDNTTPTSQEISEEMLRKAKVISNPFLDA